MIMESNPANTVGLLIGGVIGKQKFCMECEQYDTCDHSKQRIPWCVSQAIEYYHRNKFARDYPWPGGYMDQPVWLHELSLKVGEVMQEISKDKK
jgi:hypothetical protein